MRLLFDRNEAADRAWVLNGGKARFLVAPGADIELVADDLIVGLEDLFVERRDDMPAARLLKCSIEDTTATQVIPYSAVDELLSKYGFGMRCNRGLSRLIDATNGVYVKRYAQLGDELREYNLRSTLFSRLVNDVSDLAARKTDVELATIVKEARANQIYRDGETLLREASVATTPMPTTRMNRLIQEVKRDTVLCRDGEIADSMYVLLRGSVSVLRHRRLVTRIRTSGESFGEMSLFMEGRRTASLITDEDSVVYRIRRQDLKEFHEEHPNVFQCIAGTLASRLDNVVKQVRALVTITPEEQARGGRGRKGKDDIRKLFEQLKKHQRATSMHELELLLNLYRSQS